MNIPESLSAAAIVKLLPEIVLFFTAIFILLADIGYSKQRPRIVFSISVMGLLVAFAHALFTLRGSPSEIFSRTMIIDPVSQYFKLILIFSALIAVLMSWMSREVKNNEQAEMHALITLSTLGMCIMCSATHLLLLFLAYVMMSLSCMVLASFKRASTLSSEAGVKAFVHGALSSLLFALGIMILYGAGKSFNVFDIHTQLTTLVQGSTTTNYMWLAFGLIFVAIAAQMAIFPFHFVTMDVIEGSAVPVSAFFSVAPLVAAMAFAFRICVQVFSVKNNAHWTALAGMQWPAFIAAIAAVTMTVGNLTALHQTNLKRLLSFACMAQMGFVLMGLAVSNTIGMAAVLFSLAAYGFVTLGAFLVIQWIVDQSESEDIAILKGLIWRRPYEGAALCLFLLSLAGVPPLVGFVGRFYLLGIVVQEKLYWLAIIAAINWVVGLTYFLSMIKQMFVSSSTKPLPGMEDRAAQVALVALLVPTVFLGFYWDPLMIYITKALGAVSW